MENVGAIFEKMNIFFLCELPLILRVDRKRKKKNPRARYTCKGTLDIEFVRDWSAGLGVTLGDGQKIKNNFCSFWDFSRESRWCHIVGLRIYYKSRKFYQNRWSLF